MFSKDDRGTGGTEPKLPSLSKAGSVPSLLSGDLTITGDLISAGDIQIDGTVIGDIKGHALTLSQTSQVEGMISAADVHLNGRFKGTVSADNVTLSKGAKVSGDLIQNTMTIEAGADFEGSVQRLQGGKAAGSRAAPAATESRKSPKEDAAPVSPPPATS